jgi:hypothetical protein
MLKIPNTLSVAKRALPGAFSRERCKQFRARCMMVARKHKDAGNKARAATWSGFALYWSVRASQPTLPPNEADTVTRRRLAARAARSAAPSLPPVLALVPAAVPAKAGA